LSNNTRIEFVNRSGGTNFLFFLIQVQLAHPFLDFRLMSLHMFVVTNIAETVLSCACPRFFAFDRYPRDATRLRCNRRGFHSPVGTRLKSSAVPSSTPNGDVRSTVTTIFVIPYRCTLVAHKGSHDDPGRHLSDRSTWFMIGDPMEDPIMTLTQALIQQTVTPPCTN